jgi:hypothetical protein
MNKLWYNSPYNIFENMTEFFPFKDLSNERKINALARLALYFTILIIIFNEDHNWLILSILLLILSFFLGYTEKFTTELNAESCQKPTKDNPFMNYTVGDLIDNPYREGACKYDNVKNEIQKEFRAHVFADSSDLWGRNINDRNFFTNPNTSIVNDQTGFANWLLGSSGECKTTGKNCLKVRDPTFHRGRFVDAEDN